MSVLPGLIGLTDDENAELNALELMMIAMRRCTPMRFLLRFRTLMAKAAEHDSIARNLTSRALCAQRMARIDEIIRAVETERN